MTKVLIRKNLNRWFKEKWVDVSRKNKDGKHPPCGRSKAKKSSKGYPKCRPSVKVSSKTPKTSGSMSEGQKQAATKRKRAKKQGVGGKPTIVKEMKEMNAINPTIQNFKNADTAAGNFIFSNLSKIPDAAANLYVRFLSIPNKIELFGKQIPGLETILNALQGKANEIKQAREEVNRTIKIGQEILGRYSEEVQTEWNTILLELSRQNVNPETIINDPEARAELERPVGKDNAGNQFYNDKAIDLVARYEQLPKDLRDLAKLLVSDLKLKYDTLLETMIATYRS